MSHTDQDREVTEFAEESSSLWRITAGPLIWAIHFVISYASSAVYCAKFGADAESIAVFRLTVGALTLAALLGIALVGWRGWRQWDMRADRADDPDDRNQRGIDEDRHQFLGHAAFLLSIISVVGVIYVALPVVFIETCR